MATDTTTTGIHPPLGTPKLSTRDKLVLFVLCAAQFMVALDFSVLNVALPTLGADLGMSQSGLQWAVTAFALPSGGFLLLFGRIGDLYGRRRLFLTGLALFGAASLLATFAWDPASFLTGRALQGLGAATIVPTGMSLLTTTFPEGPARDRALGISGTLLSLGFTVGMVAAWRPDRRVRLALDDGPAHPVRGTGPAPGPGPAPRVPPPWPQGHGRCPHPGPSPSGRPRRVHGHGRPTGPDLRPVDGGGPRLRPPGRDHDTPRGRPAPDHLRVRRVPHDAPPGLPPDAAPPHGGVGQPGRTGHLLDDVDGGLRPDPVPPGDPAPVVLRDGPGLRRPGHPLGGRRMSTPRRSSAASAPAAP